MPFVDKLTPLIDLREQVVSFEPQPVITEDNLVVSIDSVIYFQVTDPKAATYEIADFIRAIEQLTVTTLRNVIGGMALEKTLTSRDEINNQLRGVLDEATGKWGIRVNRVELKAIDPPASIQETMEKQMRADREKRAAILTAEGVKQSQILTAEGEKQSAILRAEGQRQAMILQAEGQAQAIDTVFKAIHAGDADPKLLAYQYLQMLPQIAQGDANKVWIIPSEITQALGNIGELVKRPNDPARSATSTARVARCRPGSTCSRRRATTSGCTSRAWAATPTPTCRSSCAATAATSRTRTASATSTRSPACSRCRSATRTARRWARRRSSRCASCPSTRTGRTRIRARSSSRTRSPRSRRAT